VCQLQGIAIEETPMFNVGFWTKMNNKWVIMWTLFDFENAMNCCGMAHTRTQAVHGFRRDCDNTTVLQDVNRTVNICCYWG
jgi:hypothetical protein